MNNKKFLYVANWKNYFTYQQATSWIKTHNVALATLSQHHTLVFCPSFESLYMVGQYSINTPLKLGAQNCSAHRAGAFTGLVLVESLKELGCSYCIIGHSEVQKICPESFQELAKKAIRLLEFGITPLLCIGESAQDYELSRGPDVLRRGIESFCDALPTTKQPNNTIGIAYEPLWAVNSNATPPTDYLETQLMHIKNICSAYPGYNFLILYGGGIDETNVQQFKNIEVLDGLLIGRASTDFQKLQKIVE